MCIAVNGMLTFVMVVITFVDDCLLICLVVCFGLVVCVFFWISYTVLVCVLGCLFVWL